MKKILACAAVMLATFSLKAQDNVPAVVNYSLPRTCIVIDVTARKETFHAGPYAKYGQKYLGIKCAAKDSSSFTIKSVEVKSQTEADPKERYSLNMTSNLMPLFLNFSNQGLVSFATPKSEDDLWRFPASGKDKFATKPLPSNLESKQHKLIRESGNGFISQEAMVVKTLADKAQEAAAAVFEIRSKKYDILIGNTDATYSGEAMKAAITELNRLEKEYLSLFIGYCETEVQKAVFEVIPEDGKLNYVAFRLSNTSGLVSSKDISGSPVYLELTPEQISAAKADAKPVKAKAVLWYRIPAVCKTVLSEGGKQILETRIPVYQFGKTETCPVF